MGRICPGRSTRLPRACSAGHGHSAVSGANRRQAPSSEASKGHRKGAGVLEIVEDHDTDTFRTVYTVRFGGVIYVLHAFQKKSKRGTKTPLHEVDLIRARYEQARMAHEQEFGPSRGRTR